MRVAGEIGTQWAKGVGYLSLEKPDMNYITSIYLTKDLTAKHRYISKGTDYMWSMKMFPVMRDTLSIENNPRENGKCWKSDAIRQHFSTKQI